LLALITALTGTSVIPVSGLAAEVDALRAGGTGSALGTMQILASAFSKNRGQTNVVTLVPNLGSSGGIKALKAGAIDIAFISQAPTAEMTAAGLVSFEYGRSPFVLVTNKAGVSNISSQEVAAILSGQKPFWADGEPVRFVMREVGDSDNEFLASFSPDIAAALKIARNREGLVIAMTDQEAADRAERLPGSLAMSTLALTLSERRKLTVLNFNGVIPSLKSLADGTYPHHKKLFIVTKGPVAGTARDFIEFIQSSAGRAILEANGHLVAPR
jgi:phosphate transport system substrate-binding protein